MDEKKEQQRTQAFQNFAAQSGWQFLDNVPLSNLRGAEHFYLFSLGNQHRQISNLIFGTAGNFQVSIFDYSYTIGGREHSKSYNQTVVMLESNRLNLPLFSMRPEGLWQELGQMFGGQDIDFASHLAFSNKYSLHGANEAQIRQTFDFSVLSYLEATNELSLEGGGNRIFAYRFGTLIEPAQFRPIMDEAINAANLLSN